MSGNLFLLLALVTQPPAQGPVDLVQGRVETKGDVWVGQRVTVVVKLYSPTFFSGAAVFDCPQVPGVLILPPQGSPVIGSETVGEDTYTVQRHELAVYPQRAGTVRLPPIGVRFASDGGIGKPPVPRHGATKEMTFTAKMPPGADGLSTVITTAELTVREKWNPQPGRAKLGSAFTRTVTARAKEVPGMLIPPLRWSTPEGIHVYPTPPAVTDITERGESTGQRVEGVTYVCEKPGSYLLPGLTITWWDPTSKQLRHGRLPPQTLEVVDAGGVKEEQHPEPNEPARPQSAAWLASAFGALLLGALWYFHQPILQWFQHHREASLDSEAGAFARLRKACQGGEARCTYDALLSWLGHVNVAGQPAGLEHLAAHGDVELRSQLDALEADLFGRPGSTGGWSSSVLLHQLDQARTRLLKEGTAARHPSALPPLNPTA